jgi:hypothetical protein
MVLTKSLKFNDQNDFSKTHLDKLKSFPKTINKEIKKLEKMYTLEQKSIKMQNKKVDKF